MTNEVLCAQVQLPLAAGDAFQAPSTAATLTFTAERGLTTRDLDALGPDVNPAGVEQAPVQVFASIVRHRQGGR